MAPDPATVFSDHTLATDEYGVEVALLSPRRFIESTTLAPAELFSSVGLIGVTYIASRRPIGNVLRKPPAGRQACIFPVPLVSRNTDNWHLHRKHIGVPPVSCPNRCYCWLRGLPGCGSRELCPPLRLLHGRLLKLRNLTVAARRHCAEQLMRIFDRSRLPGNRASAGPGGGAWPCVGAGGEPAPVLRVYWRGPLHHCPRQRGQA